jgi:hypothetical protein
MNIKKFTLATTGLSLSALLLAGCSGNTGSQAPQATPLTQIETQAPAVAQVPDTTPIPVATPVATVSPSAKDLGPKMTAKDDVASLNSDLNNTTIKAENFN